MLFKYKDNHWVHLLFSFHSCRLVSLSSLLSPLCLPCFLPAARALPPCTVINTYYRAADTKWLCSILHTTLPVHTVSFTSLFTHEDLKYIWSFFFHAYSNKCHTNEHCISLITQKWIYDPWGKNWTVGKQQYDASKCQFRMNWLFEETWRVSSKWFKIPN